MSFSAEAKLNQRVAFEKFQHRVGRPIAFKRVLSDLDQNPGVKVTILADVWGHTNLIKLINVVDPFRVDFFKIETGVPPPSFPVTMNPVEAVVGLIKTNARLKIQVSL